MAVIRHGKVILNGKSLGPANGIKEGSVIDLTYPKVRKIVFDTNRIYVL